MMLLEEMLASSERVYRWLVKIHPKEFRDEYESEMVQNFRDLCREELDRLSPARMMGLWGRAFLDLAASAAIEHIRRREPMSALDRDLRWDVRYGVQMLWKHSLWLLKYTVLALVGGAVALVLAVWIWSGVRIWQKEKPVNAAWESLTGKAPEAYFQAALQEFPKSGMNETARQLEEVTTRLGMFNPMPQRLYGGERKGATGPFGAVDIPPYVLNQLRRPNDVVDPLPEGTQDYLRKHRADLDAIYGLLQQSEGPRWETDVSALVQAPVPGLMYHRQLHGLFALDILNKTRQGQSASALQALEASWRINQSLRRRPELVSHMSATSILHLQAGVIRKMKNVPVEWWQRLDVKVWQESFLRAMELDAVVLSRYVRDTDYPLNSPRSFNPLVNSPLGKPLWRLAGIEILELSGEIFSLIKKSNSCTSSPDAVLKQVEAAHSSWNLGTHYGYTNYLRAWRMSTEGLIHAELTRKILQVKAARDLAMDKDWPRQLAPMESFLCPQAEWVHEVAPNGTIQIKCRNLPEWLKKEYPTSVPLKYSLKPAS
jgi:hypothetical protein